MRLAVNVLGKAQLQNPLLAYNFQMTVLLVASCNPTSRDKKIKTENAIQKKKHQKFQSLTSCILRYCPCNKIRWQGHRVGAAFLRIYWQPGLGGTNRSLEASTSWWTANDARWPTSIGKIHMFNPKMVKMRLKSKSVDDNNGPAACPCQGIYFAGEKAWKSKLWNVQKATWLHKNSFCLRTEVKCHKVQGVGQHIHGEEPGHIGSLPGLEEQRCGKPWQWWCHGQKSPVGTVWLLQVTGYAPYEDEVVQEFIYLATVAGLNPKPSLLQDVAGAEASCKA